MTDVSRATIIGALVAIGLFGLGAVIFVSSNAESTARLGLMFGLLGAIVTGLLAALRSDQAATNTNGKLDARIQAAVHRANLARRDGDPPMTTKQVDAMGSTPIPDYPPERPSDRMIG